VLLTLSLYLAILLLSPSLSRSCCSRSPSELEILEEDIENFELQEANHRQVISDLEKVLARDYGVDSEFFHMMDQCFSLDVKV
jgi:hypothetical protein